MGSEDQDGADRVTLLDCAGLKVHVLDRRGSEAPQLVTLMHGFGAPGSDLVPLASSLPAALYAFPEAPIDLSRLPEFAVLGTFGPPPRAWWPIDMLALQDAVQSGHFEEWTQHEPEGMDSAAEQLSDALSELQRTLGVTDAETLLGGFSQGGMLATHLALTQRAELRALIILSGSLVAGSSWLPRMSARRFPVFMSHGRLDPILPFALAERLERSLAESSDAPVEWVSFDGPHGIPGAVLTRLAEFVRRF